MKILVTGFNGQLGSEVIKLMKEKKSILDYMEDIYKDVEVIGIGLENLDICDLEGVKRYIEYVRPEIIINCAAYTNVDACENDRDLAFKVNSLGPRNLAIVCEEIGAKLVHISTDYVFKGDGKIPYNEYDITNPISVYGKTKLMGENYVREFCSKYFIVRTSWLYGYNGNNFVKTIIKAAKEKRKLEVVNDQRGNPTNAQDLAYHILKLVLTNEYGIYHCTGNGECSWYEFAKAIVKYSNIDCEVVPITSDKINRAAKRPAFSSLDNMMLRVTVGDEMKNWKEALQLFIEDFHN